MDILIEVNGRLVPIEVRLSATPRPAMAKGITSLQKDLGKKVVPSTQYIPVMFASPLDRGRPPYPLPNYKLISLENGFKYPAISTYSSGF